jgi:hypothetical protein
VVPILLGLRKIFIFNHVKSDREYRVPGTGYRVQGTGYRVQGTEYRVQGSQGKLIARMRQKRLPKNIFLRSTRRRKGTEGGAGKEG